MEEDRTIVSSRCWDALIFLMPLCIFPILSRDLFPLEKTGDIVFFVLLCCAEVFTLFALLFCFYRIIIDDNGIIVQRLIAKRFFAWADIRQVIVSARLHDRYRWIQTATFSTKYLNEKERSRIGELFDRKWMVAVDLADENAPASRVFPSIDKGSFLALMERRDIVPFYTPRADNAEKKTFWG